MHRRRTNDVRIAFATIAAIAGALSTAQTVAQDVRIPESEQYKRIHVQALRPMVDGNAAEAITALEAHEAKYPGDPETQYAFAAAYAAAGQLDDAFAAVQRAVELGLPPERIAAGPREWFAPLEALPAYGEFITAQTTPLLHGPMLGNVTDSGASVWVRTRADAEVTVRYREVGIEEWRETDPATTSVASDYTAVVRLTDLRGDIYYEYEVHVDDEKVSTTRQFLTFPGSGGFFRADDGEVSGRGSVFRVVFGGGAGYVPPPERMWDLVRERNPLALLLLGDNVYSDDPERPSIQRYCYYRRQSRPEWRRLVGVTPVFAVWDDHDFADDDSWGGPAIDEPAWKRPVWETFRRNWANPGYGGGTEQPGVWFQFAIADADFFMLDSRYYRTAPETPNPSMLGPAQKAWLLESLVGSDATFKMIVSPVPMAEGTKPGRSGLDTWDGFPEERDEIFNFIRDNEIEGVVILSADRHRSDVWRIDRPGLYPIYEFESSRFTNQHVHDEMEAALFSYNDTQSFGQLDFDTTAEDPRLTYTIVSIDGEDVHSHTVRASELRFE